MLFRSAAISLEIAERVVAEPDIRVVYDCEIGEVRGYGRLEKVVLLESATGETEVIPATGLYIMFGSVPSSEWVQGVVAVDEFGFILTDNEVSRRPELLPEPWHASRPPSLAETSIVLATAIALRAGRPRRQRIMSPRTG